MLSDPGFDDGGVDRFHPIGTASMMPRNKQGVVDPDLLVYGTTNVRVADLSILPIHISTHLESIGCSSSLFHFLRFAYEN